MGYPDSKWYRLGDHVKSSLKGITPKYVDQSNIVVLNQKCIRNNQIDFSLARYHDPNKKFSQAKILRKGDLLFNSTGQGTAGRCAFVRELPESKTVITDSHILILRLVDFHLAESFSYSCYKEETLIQTFMDGSTGQGELDKLRLFNIEFKFPETAERQKICTFFNRIDAKINLNNKINQELEALAKTIYDYWFVQFDFPNENGKPYKSSGGKMVYNEELKREIPEGWEDGTLQDIAKLVRGVTYNKHDIKSPKDSNVTPVLRATNIKGNIIDLDNMVYVANEIVSNVQLLKKYDILITMSSGSKNHIGKNGLFYYDRKVAFGAFCAKLEAKSSFHFYLPSYMQSEFVFETIKKECLGTSINNLNSSMVKGFRVVIPEERVLNRFNKILEPIHAKIGNDQNERLKLTELRDWLLPMLMNGQVRVGEDEKRLAESRNDS